MPSAFVIPTSSLDSATVSPDGCRRRRRRRASRQTSSQLMPQPLLALGHSGGRWLQRGFGQNAFKGGGVRRDGRATGSATDIDTKIQDFLFLPAPAEVQRTIRPQRDLLPLIFAVIHAPRTRPLYQDRPMHLWPDAANIEERRQSGSQKARQGQHAQCHPGKHHAHIPATSVAMHRAPMADCITQRSNGRWARHACQSGSTTPPMARSMDERYA